ncbi:MAG: hypothetical protein IH851_00155 [Armatimonadetes bacterium]|nr:hypothetical protein [Armatimonadota bacterium]
MNIARIPLTLRDYLRFYVQKPQVGAESGPFPAKRPARATLVMALICLIPWTERTGDDLHDLRPLLVPGLKIAKPDNSPGTLNARLGESAASVAN